MQLGEAQREGVIGEGRWTGTIFSAVVSLIRQNWIFETFRQLGLHNVFAVLVNEATGLCRCPQSLGSFGDWKSRPSQTSNKLSTACKGVELFRRWRDSDRAQIFPNSSAQS